MPIKLKTSALAGLEKAINGYLKLDPATLEQMATLSGKVIGIELRGLNIEFYLMPGKAGVAVRGTVGATPDTTLRGTPLSLMRLGFTKGQQTLLFSGDVEIFGDTETGRRFRKSSIR
jgi:ubiquinone biosynthesis protein UbiJ